MIYYRGPVNGEIVKAMIDDGEFVNAKIEFDENDIETITIVQKQLWLNEISQLKKKLSDTDYITCKIVEGEATKEDYAFEIKERREWRRQINELEKKIEEA